MLCVVYHNKKKRALPATAYSLKRETKKEAGNDYLCDKGINRERPDSKGTEKGFITWMRGGCQKGRLPGGSAIQTGKGNLRVSRLAPGNEGRGRGEGLKEEKTWRAGSAEAQGHKSLGISEGIWRSGT